MATARSCSVQPHGFCHDSLKALPEPLNVSRRVLIPVQDEPTRGADMGTHGEALLHPFPTAATVLAGVGRWHRDDSTAGAYCLAFENGPELGPPRVLDRLVEAGLAAGSVMHIAASTVRFGCGPEAHSGDLEVFEIDRVVLP